MKFSALLLGVVAAGKGGRGGKHGNVDMEGTRYNWKIPKCISQPDFCQTDTIKSDKNGKIELNGDDYENHRNVMYRIQLGDSRRIKLKFDKKAGFGMEWHRSCGYDKVHIFAGTVDDFDNAQRIARFCGPKNKGGRPYDAARNVKPVDGSMPMWDDWMDVGTGDIIVAIDLDQDRDDFTGFVLEYESEPTGIPDFSDFTVAATELHKMIKVDTMKFKLKNSTPVISAANALFNRMIKRSTEKVNGCQKPFSGPVPKNLQETYQKLFEDPSSTDRWDHVVYGCGQLMNHYIHNCPSARDWLRAGTGGKLKHIVEKRNSNLDRS